MLTNVSVNYLSSIPVSVTATPTRVVQGNTTQLVYYGDPGVTVTWNPNTFVVPKTGYTVTAMPDRPTTYTVIAFNGPCRETLYVFVDVVLNGCEEGDSFVPNTFTPNGDGRNDYFRPLSLGLKSLDLFKIFNRWGQLLYNNTDLESPGWEQLMGLFRFFVDFKPKLDYEVSETAKAPAALEKGIDNR